MSTGRARFNLSEMGTDEVEIPSTPLISRAPSPELVRPAEQGTEPAHNPAPAPTPVPQPAPRARAKRDTNGDQWTETEFAISEVRTPTSLSLLVSVNKRLDNWVFDLKKKGHKTASKQALMEKAIIELMDRSGVPEV